MTKTCSVCGEPVGHSNQTGLCRKCYFKKYREENHDTIKAIGKRYYKENKEEIIEKVKVYRDMNKEHLATYNKKWHEENTEKVAEYGRTWAKNNPEKAKAHNKQYYHDNKTRCRAINKKWNEDNPERARAMRRDRRIYLSTYADCTRLNAPFPGCAAHHIDPDTIIHIPATLHHSTLHSLKTGKGMEELNLAALDWMEGVRRESPQTTLVAFG